MQSATLGALCKERSSRVRPVGAIGDREPAGGAVDDLDAAIAGSRPSASSAPSASTGTAKSPASILSPSAAVRILWAMKVAAFADEINREDPDRALLLARRWGLAAIEVRALPGGRFPRLPDAALDGLARRVRDAGLAVSGVSPGLSRLPVEDPRVDGEIGEVLPRACDWARHWGTDLVSCFGFARGGAPHGSAAFPTAVVDTLGRMARTAVAHGCRLVLENEAVCWGDTGDEAAALVRAVGAGLRLCWDPGNSARAGALRPFPDEYAGLRDLTAHVHVKNYDPAAQAWSLVEAGAVAWPGQLRALAADGYDGWLVVETHTAAPPVGAPPLADAGQLLAPLEANTLRNLRALRAWLA